MNHLLLRIQLRSLSRSYSYNQRTIRAFTAGRTSSRVWILTDGGLESTLQSYALGKRLAARGQLDFKTVTSKPALQMFPSIFQKYIVEWNVQKSDSSSDSLPWYLTSSGNDNEGSIAGDRPDYVICSGTNAIPTCLHLAHANQTEKRSFSVYLGMPTIPFISFDQVVLPKYEANAKLAKLGPLAHQKNCIIPNMPLLDFDIIPDNDTWKQAMPTSFMESLSNTDNVTAVVVGGYNAQCRWYSEDAITLVDNMRRMIQNLNSKVVLVFTDKTTDMVKDKMIKAITTQIDKHEQQVAIWDAADKNLESLSRIVTYEGMLNRASRIVLTADLDYATAHAASKRKPVYTVFAGRCRSYLLQFHHWCRENQITRKLRLERKIFGHGRHGGDPYSYLGHHEPWGDSQRILRSHDMTNKVKAKIEELHEEMVTGKRRR
ncbi:mitochondrial fission ELM1-domain-containing protein, partial [Radiomyces spectabilis]|uniref:mitochondrial fission ELM1-domain-containing protein n=1 Tax=Radiomyces spectabilis TaxID=64574 RepID=UPI00221EF21F